MKKKKKAAVISKDERESIDLDERQVTAFYRSLETSKRFNVGDYLIVYHKAEWEDDTKYTPRVNSYGAPVKYKVVHTTENGLAYAKTIDKNGEPYGDIYPCFYDMAGDWYTSSEFNRYELDPDYADSLILGIPYDPAILHNSKKDIYRDVTKHNKESKVNTDLLMNVVDFFKEAKVGDTLWTSINGSYFIQDKRDITKADLSNNRKLGGKRMQSLKGPFISVLTIRDKNGKVKDVTADFFYGKALYKSRPRTYRELNI